ncbi:MAG: histidine triad nucleotide-binding protein [Fidelibacterota bacterium]|nr:MAG: histidine triad nucleotide-binding protein [Candidatus Neomarinimicrobiota bacterium]
MSDTIFMKIINKEIPSDIIHEDDQCVAFRDVNPQAPVHFLVVPRKAIPRLQDLSPEDEPLIGHIHSVITLLADKEGIAEGYRVVANSGASAGQSVFHLHFHVLGGRPMHWPPG